MDVFQVLSNTTDMAQFQRTSQGKAAYLGLLQIRSVNQIDFGDYECEASNKYGSDAQSVKLSPKSKSNRQFKKSNVLNSGF